MNEQLFPIRFGDKGSVWFWLVRLSPTGKRMIGYSWKPWDRGDSGKWGPISSRPITDKTDRVPTCAKPTTQPPVV